MTGMRWRFWLDQLTSPKSLATAGAAAIGLAGWATTHNPLFGWLMLGGSGAWTALMYYLLGTASGDASALPDRRAAVWEVEQALGQFRLPGDEDERARWRERESQLRRIVELERLVLTDLPATPSGIRLLSAEQQLEVDEFVEQAIDLSRRRGLLLRALVANPLAPLEAELHHLAAQRRFTSERVAADLDELIKLKHEQVERIHRWRDDLSLSEINLDQIETFLRALAYDQTVTATNVTARIERLKSRVQARKDSVEELERRVKNAAG